MTNLEMIAREWPLHAQRIAELSDRWWPSQPYDGNRWRLLGAAFMWDGTTEGHVYWEALATGAGVAQ